MALDTYQLHKVHWTDTEDEIIISTWNKWVGKSGQAHRGLVTHLATILPGRSLAAIRHRKAILVKTGKVPPQWERVRYTPLILGEQEKGYLAAILDGEGSVRNPPRPRLGGTDPCGVAIVYNTDVGILDYVQSLIPAAVRYKTGRGLKPNGHPGKQCYGVIVQDHRAVLDFLVNILPYMRHTEKIEKARTLIEYIKNGRMKNC